jgi:hypothetical protein
MNNENAGYHEAKRKQDELRDEAFWAAERDCVITRSVILPFTAKTAMATC